MTYNEAETFVSTFVLHHPLLDKPLEGAQIPMLTRAQLRAAPDLVWSLLDWTMRGDTIVLEWRNRWTLMGSPFQWEGVDKITLESGRIIEERVYVDTAPLRAAKEGRMIESPLSALLDQDVR